MNRYLLLLLLFTCSWASTANMAKTSIDGTSHSSLILTNDCTVSYEKITAQILKNPHKEVRYKYIILFKIKYKINAPANEAMPLVFMASNYLQDHKIFVNGENISSIPIDEKQNYPFLRKEVITDTLQLSNSSVEFHTYTNYYITYDSKEEEKVELSDLIHFIAPLKKGENTIEVSYTAFPEVLRDDFIPQYDLEYSTYPSKFWKTFPEIEVEIHFPKELEFEQSSMGKEEYRVSNQLFQGKIKDIHLSGNCYWRFSPKPSWIGLIVLTISPLGFGIILFLCAVVLHLYYINKKSKWGLWLGVFLTPIFFYIGFMGAYPLIMWILDSHTSPFGYFFLITFTYPIFVILYGMVTFIYYYLKKSKGF
ncbi:hypothetical protein [Capnocytophaga granulosa]|uniref:hypothetical protein n=1 Tax=Capnocytophaga granulosa TaxID=45242 RepID=UPI00361448E6